MQDVGEYTVEAELHQGQSNVVYRARSRTNGERVVLKLLRNEFPTVNEIARFEREFRVASNLKLKQTVRIKELIRFGHRPVIVYLDDGAISLRRYFGGRALDIGTLLDVALGAASAVAELHCERLVHHDINPANLLIEPTSREIKLTDLELARSPYVAASGARTIGTLAYLSPEQSGRTNAQIDARSDLYSLGATIYELACGRVMFDGLDDASLLHAHFARTAAPIYEQIPNFPALLEQLIFKLIAKSPADRYQSAEGLVYDLNMLRNRFREGVSIDNGVALGASDHFVQVEQSDRLYGRDLLFDALEKSVQAAKEGKHPCWINLVGPSGGGKSSALQRFGDEHIGHSTLCIGHADKLSQATPFASLIQAFSKLIQRWLTLPDAELNRIRDQIKRGLGMNLAVLMPLMPELEKITGAAPKLIPLGETAEQTRFFLALRNFLQIAAAQQAPLVLCIDDFQWIDSASVKFLEKLLASDVSACVLVTAIREEDLSAALRQALGLWAQLGIKEHRHTLLALTPEQITHLVRDVFAAFEQPTDQDKLVQVLLDRTQGNPFFVRQYLSSLVQVGVLEREQGGLAWRYREDLTHQISVSDNVLNLLSENLERLSPDSAKLLKTASCVGNSFDLTTVAALLANTQAQAARAIDELIQQSMIVATEVDAGLYRFVHERLREATMNKLSEFERASMHLKIGRLWKADTQRNLFDVVAQLNRGIALIETDQERNELCALNARAAAQARSQTAYQAALEFAGFAASLLSLEQSNESMRQAYDVHVLLAQSQASAGELDSAIQVFEHAITLTEDVLEQAAALASLCDALQSSGQPAMALVQVQRALQLLGEDFKLGALDDAANLARIETEQSALMAELANESALVKLKQLPDANRKAAQISALYDKAIIGVYFTRPQHLTFVTAKCLGHVLNSGWTAECGIAFGWFAMILGMFNQHALGAKYAEMAVQTHTRFGNDFYGGGAKMLAHAQSLCWILPYQENAQKAQESYVLLHQSGNLQFASYALITQHISAVAQAADVGEMLASCERWGEYCERYVPLELGQAQIRMHCLRRLIGVQQAPLDYETILASYTADNNATDVCEALAQMAHTALILGDSAEALALSERASPMFSAGAAGTLLLNYTHLVVLAVAAAREARKLSSAQTHEIQWQQQQDRLLKLFEHTAARVRELSALNPQNFAAYDYWIQAEGGLLAGDRMQATVQLLSGIRHARQHGYLLVQAQLTELLAETMRSEGDEFAGALVRESEQLYRRATCLCKVSTNNMDESQSLRSKVTRIQGGSASTGAHGVDLLSVLKANEAIASEMDFDRLLVRLLDIAVENAGAKRGVLLLKENNQFFIEADSDVGRVHEALLDSKRCPIQMMQFVARSGIPTVLDDGAKRSTFREDTYFIVNKARSVLACPILRQGELRGIVYLENDAVVGAFNHERLEMINMLLGQAAIALENATLYRNQLRYTDELEARVKERTTELEEANLALARLAEIDGLTQIANRRQFDRLSSQYEKEGAAVGILLCDVDDFKAYNDHYGHPAGDDVLRKVAGAISSLKFPFPVLVARYGGEEFVLLVKAADAELVAGIAERVCAVVRELVIFHGYARAAEYVTLSVGASFSAICEAGSIETLKSRADQALYSAKRTGRNRAQVWRGASTSENV